MWFNYQLEVNGRPGDENPTELKVSINTDYEKAFVLLTLIRQAVVELHEGG